MTQGEDLNNNDAPTIQLDSLSVDSLGKVKKINQAVLPLSYSKSFYKGLLDPSVVDFCKVAIQADQTVGAICVSLERNNEQRDDDVLWIMTLAVLVRYRNMGVGSLLMDSLLKCCKEKNIRNIALHVQTSNDDAIRFYTKKFGFQQGERLKNYYPRLDPSDCFILHKRIDSGSTAKSLLNPFSNHSERTTDKDELQASDDAEKPNDFKRRKLESGQSL